MARRPRQEEAAQWLRSYLANGSRSRQEIKDAAYQLGISSRTLDRVKLDLGIESVRRGTDYHWRDPDIFEDRALSQSLNDTIDRAIDRLADKLAGAIRQLASQRQQPASAQPSGQPEMTPEEYTKALAELPEPERFARGFEHEDYEYADAGTLARFYIFQGDRLQRMEAEPESESRDQRIEVLRKQMQQTVEWYNKKMNAATDQSPA
jgi:hypothetical protein